MADMTQKQRLLNWLQDGYSINRLEGWDRLGIIELPARVSELRQEGYNIITEMVKVTNRYGDVAHVAVWSLNK